MQNAKRPESPDILILGSGNAAFCLSQALHSAGLPLRGLWARNPERARRIAERLNLQVFSWEEVVQFSGWILICVQDDAIAELALQLRGVKAYVSHTSGSVSLESLEGIEHRSVWYPLQTMSENRSVNFENVPFFVEKAQESGWEFLDTVAQGLGGYCIPADSDKRKQLHLAAVIACNFTQYNLRFANRLLENSGYTLKMMEPLIQSTLSNLFSGDPEQAQTGPAKRGDQQTLAKHRALLNHEEEKAFYDLVSRLIQGNILPATRTNPLD